MGNPYCQKHCIGWRGIINFIPGVPRYILADRCSECEIWFPKYQLLRCPCCNNRLKQGRTRFSKGLTNTRDMDKERIKERIQFYVEKKGWTLLKKEVWKTVLDYCLLHRLNMK